MQSRPSPHDANVETQSIQPSDNDKNLLFIEWVDYQAKVLGSRKAVARRMGKHENTISRIANRRKTVGEETLQAFRNTFGVSELEYLLGPDHYRRKLIDAPLDLNRLTQVYPLRHLCRTLSDCSRSWSVWSHQHQTNYRDYVHIYVDVADRGLPLGVEAVINVNRQPSAGDTVLLWAASESTPTPHPHFTLWHDNRLLSTKESLFGVLEYVMSD